METFKEVSIKGLLLNPRKYEYFFRRFSNESSRLIVFKITYYEFNIK